MITGRRRLVEDVRRTLLSGPDLRLCVAATLPRRRHVSDGWVNGDQRTNDAIEVAWLGTDARKVQLDGFRAES
jgi:hypothetical protein